MALERISIEVTNRCAKACAFCYNRSAPDGRSTWSPEDLIDFVRDCAGRGVRAASFGGGEPLQYEGIFDVLSRLRGVLFRSLTTSGLPLDAPTLDRLVEASPDKVHLSIHFPDRPSEVRRVIGQVHALADRGLRSGVNLLVARSGLEAAARCAADLRRAGIGDDRIVYLPMRGRDTPTPDEIARVAGRERFQSMTCLMGCGRSPRFASIAWDRTVAFCSYTVSRRPLASLTYESLEAALTGLDLVPCGGTDES